MEELTYHWLVPVLDSYNRYKIYLTGQRTAYLVIPKDATADDIELIRIHIKSLIPIPKNEKDNTESNA